MFVASDTTTSDPTITSAEPPILRLGGLRHRLVDKSKNEHFTVYVEHPLELVSRDFIGLLGPSGCGKTTLLTILGLLRSPSDLDAIEQFELFVPEVSKKEDLDSVWKKIDIREAWKRRRRSLIEKLRREHFGFALQSGELISSLTVRENIAMPLRLNRWRRAKTESRVDELIDQFQLNRIRETPTADSADDYAADRADDTTENTQVTSRKKNALANSRVNRLSGGEYQRVSLARSIAHRPSVVFVDEPTSALNRELAHDALSVMCDLQRSRKQAGITFMITHDEELAREFCNVIVRMAPRRNEPAGEVLEVVRT